MAPMITVKNIYREFLAGTQRIQVLKDISFSINQGEMLAIVGASGSGKSTLMNILGCLDKPTRGEIYINGIAVHSADSEKLAELRSQYLGFIFQRYHLMPYLTAEENIAIPALYTAMPEQERQSRIQLLAQQLGIETRLAHKPFQLSGGQQQRVSVCRALVNGAKVILADEPTGALDSTSGKALMSVLHQLHQAGHTVIIVTHDRNIAQQTQRIIEISDGEIISDNANNVLKDEAISPCLPVVNSNGRASLWRRGLESVRMAFRALLGHRMRAFLSMLGIIIGISSVVSSVAVGEGAKRTIIEEIGKLGKTTLEIRPGLGWGSKRPDLERALSLDDVNSLATLPWVTTVSPVITSVPTIIYKGLDSSIMLNGVSDSYITGQGIAIIQGDSFHQLDIVNKEPVFILDDNSRHILFGPNEEPLNQLVQINGTPWRIIGIAKKAGPKMTNNFMIGWAPYTAVSQRITGDKPFEAISVNFVDTLDLKQATSLVESHLMKTHGTKDFFIESDDQIAMTLQKTSDSMSLLITSIAAISLLVGGVGVMNIMLVSVTERTHEIGIRLSVGARPSDIMTQFLIEAVMICLLGGVIGIAGALASGAVFSYLAVEFRMVFTLTPILFACGFSVLIGFMFGYFPAYRAAKLNPTEALARE
ncbi:ATP-binding cassette domain-containing protein [Providencia rettgeri]|uniref:Pyoverdine export ATP-binding/permease protein PvdT n=1 Tax=Providencia rettgeri TaxID=587 RepID=A0AAP2JYM5_PRORE|nr:ATP-binding cassette domain-containing protein [Providencia rettgeri]MBX6950741.1 ATP-binding cassette domain-containing protein [Providencia rettgeri]MBX6955282.1 ATP-binding cassette domain-containing protein [Providencia rettgeri]MBX6958636.1 ATP-binding cassette domain-containing protein [Providencia rettgeri]MBX6971558.1 ATP-binding cassette domain-containing protein [Providencia rettgeri]MBX6980997.1 ATP-binding cassette domain-containing protein [Providencia rettgeri]